MDLRMIAAAALGLMIVTLAGSGRAHALPSYLQPWQQYYPESTLPQRMAEITGSACMVCHHPGGFGIDGTCYREDIGNFLDRGHTILQAIALADGLDSDGDGVTNGEEILMPRHDSDHIGYHPGLAGVYGTDPCGPDPDQFWTGASETPGEQAIPGDLNADGQVNVDDLLTLLSAWGPCLPLTACVEDINNDGVVDVDDLLILLANWG